MKSRRAPSWLAAACFAMAMMTMTSRGTAAEAQKKIPGVSLGSFAVSQNGAATYSIPIIMPPSVGPNPKLSLAYDSQKQNGLLGVGWSLQGLPNIQRCARTVAQDGVRGSVNFDANDRACLDGQRLMTVNGLTDWTDGAEYRTEIDSFLKIFFRKATTVCTPERCTQLAEGFRVISKDGNTMSFELKPSITIGRSSPTGRVYALTNVSDLNRKSMDVTYEEDPTNGDARPLQISYKDNSAQFIYEDRPDKTPQYIHGVLFKTIKRLAKIQTFAPTSPTSGPVMVREYRLAYEPGSSTQRSRLTSVTECAWNALSATFSCMPPTNFMWQEGPDGKYQSITKINDGLLNAVCCGFGDINGDGKIDIWSQASTALNKFQVALSNGDGTFQAPVISDHPTGWYQAAALGDFDGDGRGDILSIDPNKKIWVFAFANRNGSGKFTGSTPVSQPTGWVAANAIVALDFDGDGRTDLLNWTTTTKFMFAFSNGDGTVRPSPVITTPTGWNLNTYRTGDFNGDGKADLISVGNSKFISVFSNGDGTITVSPNQPAVPTGWDSSRMWAGDFNGDGITDLVSRNANKNQLIFAFFKGDGTYDTAIAAVPVQLASGVWTDNATRVGDFNGDKKADIFTNNKTTLTTFFSRGDGTVWSVADTLPGNWDPVWTEIHDMSGDGKDDVVNRPNGQLGTIDFSKQPFPDLLTSIVNSIGGKIDITYKPLTDNNVYAKANDAAYPVMDLQAAIYAVDSHTARTQADGKGQNFTFTYDYAGLKFHEQGRGGLGFNSTTVLDTSTGVQTQKTFFQEFPLIGAIDLAQTMDSTDGIFAQVKNHYTPTPSNPSTNPKVIFPALTRVDTSDCDGHGVCLQSAVEYEYDTSGNRKRTHSLGDVSLQEHESDELTEWFIDPIKWIHSPSHISLFELDPVASIPSLLREKWLTYDGNSGLLTKEESRAATGIAGDQGGALNPVFTYTYDTFGNRDSTTDPIGCTTKITVFDFTGTFPATTVQCFGEPGFEHATNFTWDVRFGAKKSETDPNNQMTSFEYDDFGRVVKVIGPLDSTDIPSVGYAYPDWNDPGLQRIQTFKTKDHGVPYTILQEEYFDGLGRFYKSQSDGPEDNLGQRRTIAETTTFDSRGLVTSKVAPRFIPNEPALPAMLFEYDVLGRQTKITYPDGRNARTIYQPGEVTLIDENGHEKIKIFDAFGRVAEVQEVTAIETYVTTYDYDAADSLIHSQNHLGHNTSIKYDLLGRKAAMCDPNMGAGPNAASCDTTTPGAWTYEYDNAGNLISQKDAKNQTLIYDYDKKSRLKHKTLSAGTITFTYDQGTNGIGRLTQVDDLGGLVTTFSYDSMGRVIQAGRAFDGGAPHTLTQTYNALSSVKTETFSDDSETINYTYDNAGWLKSVSGYVSDIQYNARGQRDEIQYVNGVTTTFDYFDQLVTPPQKINFRLKNRNTTGHNPDYMNLQDLDYDYDDVGNTTSITDHLFTGTRDLLRYDELNRLVEARGKFDTNQGQITCGYSYNAIGNLQDRCGTQLFYENAAHPSFVSRTSDGRTYNPDDNGNTSSGAGRTFIWTPDNRVASVTMGGITTMDYDYTGFRFKKTNGAAVTQYIFSGYEVGPDGVAIKYIKAGNEILAAKKSTGEILFYHNDRLGGINVITDGNGARKQLTEYDPWGTITRNEPANSSVDPSRRFTGQELDAEIDLYYYGGRYYDQ
ncbi:MAG TPA: FG-GAP-like repeat-containing protein, partial [Verrucomicrobiae bacterium]|nr:FG-GAP-like repeat-containing protein [Verrucomicrobiae bacterium]